MGLLLSSSRARALVVSHEARLTGAPRVAAEVLRSLRAAQAGDGEVVCVLRAGGPLAGELAAAADRLVTEPLPRPRALLKRWRSLRTLADRLDELVALLVLARRRPAVAYLNTVKAACYVRPAIRLGIPVVLHVHELEPLASRTLRRYPVGRRWGRVHLVACSTAAAGNLARLLGRPVEQVAVVTSPVDVDAVVDRARHGNARPGPPGALVVGACGTLNERKGADVWVEMARIVRRRRPDLDVRFRWVGRTAGAWAQALAGGLRPEDRIELAGEVANPYPELAAMDVFTLPSRSDPFPLVVLEAMSLARPIVAFDVDGVPEQLGDAGALVPPADAAKMAEAVITLLDDRSERERLGAEAARRVRARYGLDGFRPAVRRVVDAALGGPLSV